MSRIIRNSARNFAYILVSRNRKEISRRIIRGTMRKCPQLRNLSRCLVVSIMTIMDTHLNWTRGIIFVFREQALCQNWRTIKCKNEINECDKKARYMYYIINQSRRALQFPLWYCSLTYPVTDTPNSVALYSHNRPVRSSFRSPSDALCSRIYHYSQSQSHAAIEQCLVFLGIRYSTLLNLITVIIAVL